MSKTLTTYEALKANETKRVRPVGSESWWDRGALINCINSVKSVGMIATDWEAEETLIERWVTVDPDGNLTGLYKASEPAHERAATNERVVHLREVRP